MIKESRTSLIINPTLKPSSISGCEGDEVKGGIRGECGFMQTLWGLRHQRTNKVLNYVFTTSLTFRPVAATNERFR